MSYSFVFVSSDGVTWGELLPDKRRGPRSHLVGKRDCFGGWLQSMVEC